MLNNSIGFITPALTSEALISVLETLFVFKDEHWKKEIQQRESEKSNFHIHISIKEPYPSSTENLLRDILSRRIVIDSVSTEVWDRDDNNGVDLLLVLNREP